MGPAGSVGRLRVGVHDLEVGPGELLQVVQLVVVPARVRCAADVPGRAVVGEDHAVALESGQDDARLRPEAGDVDRGLEAHAQAHRRQVRTCGRGEMAGRVDVSARLVRGEADGVANDAGGYFVVAN